MRTFAVLLAFFLVASGCSARMEPEEPAEPIVVNDPSDFSYLNQTDDATEHLHDYWNGQDRLPVLEETMTRSYTTTRDVVVGEFRPEPGPGIPQGAATVEILVSWTTDPADLYEGLELWVRSAADREPKKIATLKQKETVVVPTTNEQNDLPHQRLSGWKFDVIARPKSPGPATIWSASVNMKVEAVRGLDIPLYPGHPDGWQGRTEFELLNNRRTIAFHGEMGGMFACAQGQCVTDPHHPADGTLVPWNAKKIIVEITHDTPTPWRLGLLYHGSDSWELKRTPFDTAGTMRRFTIPVEAGDGPYAKQSAWEFVPFVDQETQVRAWHGTYSIKATVYEQP